MTRNSGNDHGDKYVGYCHQCYSNIFLIILNPNLLHGNIIVLCLIFVSLDRSDRLYPLSIITQNDNNWCYNVLLIVIQTQSTQAMDHLVRPTHTIEMCLINWFEVKVFFVLVSVIHLQNLQFYAYRYFNITRPLYQDLSDIKGKGKYNNNYNKYQIIQNYDK